jgi:hypothetical protein
VRFDDNFLCYAARDSTLAFLTRIDSVSESRRTTSGTNSGKHLPLSGFGDELTHTFNARHVAGAYQSLSSALKCR